MGERASLSCGAEAELVLVVPDGARAQPAAELPALELPAIGATLTGRAGWLADGSLTARAACVRAPSDRWAPGVEDLVLGRATDMARRASGAELDIWSGGPIETVGPALSQRLEGEGRAGDLAVAATGKHWLGFVGEHRDAVLCSVVCVEPSPATRCAALVESAELRGTLMEPPPARWWVRGLLLAADHPREAFAGAAILTVALVTVILARRPRPGRNR